MELRGSLQNFPLPDIIQLIGMGRRSGLLAVDLEDRKAQLWFDNGDIVHALMGESAGAEVVFRIFREQAGHFQFSAGEPPPQRTIHTDWMNLVMEAARRLDEAENLGVPELELDEDAEITLARIDLGATKRKMTEVLEQAFGRKGKRLQEELAKVDEDVDKLLQFCDKAEKFIFVFIDNQKAKGVADAMRKLLEADRF